MEGGPREHTAPSPARSSLDYPADPILSAHRAQSLCTLVVRVKQVGAPGLGALQGLLAAPLGDFGVVAGKEDLGDLQAAEVLRARVLRVLQQAGAEGVVFGGILVAEGAGKLGTVTHLSTPEIGDCPHYPATETNI
jgi:hypothetical protein